MHAGRPVFLVFLAGIALISCFQPRSRLGPEPDGGRADQASAHDAQADQPPSDDAPADQPPSDDTLVDQALADQAPADQALADQASPDQGLVDQAPAEAPADQGSPADEAADSRFDALRPCDPSRSFGTPSVVLGLGGPANRAQSARFSLDELTVYFHRYDTGDGDNNIYTASRRTRMDAFDAGQKVLGVNSELSDAWPSITADGQKMVFESFRFGVAQVFAATRKPNSNDFSGAMPVVNINYKPGNILPSILPDGSAIYFASSRIGGPGSYSELFVAYGSDVPALVSNVNSASDQYLPTLTPDELTIYFGSDRIDPSAKGDFDIWMATRSSRLADFNAPVNLQELNTGSEDLPQWISPDNCRFYFSQAHNGSRTIYVAERQM